MQTLPGQPRAAAGNASPNGRLSVKVGASDFMIQSLDEFIRDAMQEHDVERASAEDTICTGTRGGAGRLGGLAGHRVEDFIARGGMGAVYRARQEVLEREVAVKVMTGQADSAEVAERFRREALVLGRLEHPNIVPIYDLGHDEDGHLFYSMKLVKGRTLQTLLNDLRKEQPEALRDSSLKRLLDVFRKICDAISFAHSRGVLHRDLKPDNIMVGEFGEVLVMDWGLAKLLGSNDEPKTTPSFDSKDSSFSGTLSGAVMGTPQYMSPEQALGQNESLDVRSDVYALGGILYAILTLRPPVEGKTAEEVLKKVGSGQITAPSQLHTSTKAKGDVPEASAIKPLPHLAGGRVPAALSSVAMKALAKERAQRYPDARSLGEDIEKWQSGFATMAEEAGLARQLTLLVKRHKTPFVIAAAAWLLITLLAVIFVFNLREKEKRALAGEASAVQGREAARVALAKSSMALAEASLRERNGPAMQESLRAVPENLRDSTWQYLMDQSDTSFRTFEDSGTQMTGVAAHPLLPHVFALGDSTGTVRVMDVASGDVLRKIQRPTAAGEPRAGLKVAFSKDGKLLAVGENLPSAGLAVYQSDDGTLIKEWPSQRTSSLEFSDDGSTLLQVWLPPKEFTCGFSLWQVSSGKEVWSRPAQPSMSQIGLTATFLQGGESILVSCNNDLKAYLLSVGDGSMGEPFPMGSTAPVTVSRDGTKVLTADFDGVVRAYDLPSRRPMFEDSTHGGVIRAIAFTPDERRFATVAVLQDGRQIIAIRDAKTGALVHSCLGGTRAISEVRFHPVTGDLFVGGALSKVWLGKVPAWEMATLMRRIGAFWRSDDVFIGPGKDGQLGLLKLTPAGTETVSALPQMRNVQFSASTDGGTALLASSLGVVPYCLMRNPGPAVETTSIPPRKRCLLSVRLGPEGGRFIARDEFSAQFYLFEAETGTLEAELKAKGQIRANDLAWIDGGKSALSLLTMHAERGNAECEEWIAVWDLTTHQMVRHCKNGSPMDALAVSPDGRRFAEAGTDKKVRIRETTSLEIQREFRAHDNEIAALAWHPTLPVLATASLDLTIRLWDVNSGKCLDVIPALDTRPVALSFSPGGKHLTCTDERFVKIWTLTQTNDPRVISAANTRPAGNR